MTYTKFRLNLDEVDANGEECDFEYLATTHPDTPNSTLVTWSEGFGNSHRVMYLTSDVEEYFEEGIWIKI